MKPRRGPAPAGVQAERVEDRLFASQQRELGVITRLCGGQHRGLSVPRCAPAPTATLEPPPLRIRGIERNFMCMLAASTTLRPTSALRLPFSPRARAQIGLFLLAYAVYTVARFFTIGDLAAAKDHAFWIVDVENTFHINYEATIQQALDGTWL